MDKDDYDVVSKDFISDLENENKELKKKLRFYEKHHSSLKDIDPIVRTIQDESRKERDLILTSLREIKELNKSTLNNIVSKNDALDNKLDVFMEALNTLVSSLSDIAHEMEATSDKNSDKSVHMIKKELERIISDSGIKSIEVKLNEIEEFMVNLRSLLAQLRLDDLYN